MRRLISILFLILVQSYQLFACPLVSGLLDFNCNEKLKVVVTGDSIVEGRVLAENNLRGGYVSELKNLIPQLTLVNLGVWAITSGELLGRFTNGSFAKKLRGADVVIIDVGRNDCRDKLPALVAFRNIKRLMQFIRNNIGDANTYPYVLVAHQIPVRTERRTCVESLNKILLRRKNSADFPAHLRFDTLPESILSSDNIHPNTEGYKRMARFVERFIKNDLQDLLVEARPEIAPG